MPRIKQVPLAVLTTTVYSTLVYIMAGLNTHGGQFPYFVLVMVVCNLVALSFCQVWYIFFPGHFKRRSLAAHRAFLSNFAPRPCSPFSFEAVPKGVNEPSIRERNDTSRHASPCTCSDNLTSVSLSAVVPRLCLHPAVNHPLTR